MDNEMKNFSKMPATYNIYGAIRFIRGGFKCMSVNELAKELNVTPSAISSYESGRFNPSSDTQKAYARIMNVSVDFIREHLNPNQGEDNVQYLLRVVRDILKYDEKQLSNRQERQHALEQSINKALGSGLLPKDILDIITAHFLNNNYPIEPLIIELQKKIYTKKGACRRWSSI